MTQTRPADPQRPYETEDVRVKWVVWFIVGLALTTIAVFVAMWGLFGWYRTTQASGETMSRFAAPREQPPNPRLQVSEPADYQKFKVLEHQKTETYRWIDKNTGTVQIPVERAIDLVLQRGIDHALPQGKTR